MNKLLLLSFLIVFSLTACDNDNQTYKLYTGESENWQVRYEIYQPEENKQETSFSISYKGVEPLPEERISYAFDYDTGSTKGEDILNENGLIEGSGSMCEGCAQSEAEAVAFEIDWGEKSEKITLTP
ncbi:hypothetical protein ERJ70_05080 [Sediminibacillus dalangtanensis]|uniref:Lipoprotein n=1 Tax=Sediminibacillus dalangtanensis TaxID=2729421 RepID=A0ABX7VRW5_9BACI|nr:hypothetical protein [Sediminibacillus dalangtanensis]QTM98724.1 hypothetical protein ERJ70_05080 [Sediminibacillus dalangtanensis]